jgi:hypothetical protein
MWQTPIERKQELWRRIIVLVGFLALVLAIGTIVFHWLEGWSYVNSLYFATISLMSRGWSDLHPTKVSSTLFTAGYLILGVAVLLYGLSSFMAYFISFYQPRLENKLHHIVDKITHKSDKYLMIKSRARPAFDPRIARPQQKNQNNPLSPGPMKPK